MGSAEQVKDAVRNDTPAAVCCIEREEVRETGEEDGIYGEATELGVFGVGRGRRKGRCL